MGTPDKPQKRFSIDDSKQSVLKIPLITIDAYYETIFERLTLVPRPGSSIFGNKSVPISYMVGDKNLKNAESGEEVEITTVINSLRGDTEHKITEYAAGELMKAIRSLHWDWKVQFNTNVKIFKKGFANERQALRTVLLLLKKPEFLLLVQELGDLGFSFVRTGASNALIVKNWDGTNVRDIFDLSKSEVDFLKANGMHQYKIALANKFKSKFSWTYDQSSNILNLLKKSDFTEVYDPRTGLPAYSHRGAICEQMASEYSYTKVFNYFNKYGPELTNGVSNIIIDTWKMITDLKLLDPGDKYPVIIPKTARAYHDTILPYYNHKHKKITVPKGSKGFSNNSKRASNYMNHEVDGYAFEVIETKNALDKEGYKLSHCIASYYDKVDKGDSIIVAMRRAAKKTEPFITVEVAAKNKSVKLLQNYGKGNRYPTGSESDVIKKWVDISSKAYVDYREAEKMVVVNKDKDKFNVNDLKKMLKSRK